MFPVVVVEVTNTVFTSVHWLALQMAPAAHCEVIVHVVGHGAAVPEQRHVVLQVIMLP